MKRKGIPEGNRIGGAHPDFAASVVGCGYEFQPAPSFRRDMTGQILFADGGVECSARGERSW